MGAYGTPELQSPNSQPPKTNKRKIGAMGIIAIILVAIILLTGIAGMGWGPSLLFFGFVGIIIYLCSLIVMAIRKKNKKAPGIGVLGSVAVFVIGAALMPPSNASSSTIASASKASNMSSSISSKLGTSSKAVQSSEPSSKIGSSASSKPKVTSSAQSKDTVAQYKKQCSTYKYKKIARNPNNYTGQKAKFTGQVVQIEESWGSDVIRLNVTKDQYGIWSDTIYVDYTPKSENESRILEDDIITVYGELSGIKTYTTVLMSDVSIPYLKAQYVDISAESK